MTQINSPHSGGLLDAFKHSGKSLFAVGLAASLGAAGFSANIHASISLTRIGAYESGIFDESAAEINAFDPINQRVFVINAENDNADVLDLSDPTTPVHIGAVDFSPLADGGLPSSPNSVAYSNGIIAIALAADAADERGIVAFYDASADFSVPVEPLATQEVGFLPDMVTFTPDGSLVVVANEGEASTDLVDGVPAANPDGSVSVIAISGGVDAFSVDNHTEANFDVFAPGGALQLGATLEEIKAPFGPDAPKVRIHPNAASVQADLEPEYIAISPDGSTAYVALQENNAIAVLDLATQQFTALHPLGLKDHSLFFNAIDANREDDAAVIAPQPLFGLYMPDMTTTYEVDGQVYIVTANEGDTRDPGDFGDFGDGGLGDEVDLEDIDLDETLFPNAAFLQDDDIGLGKLGTLSFGNDLDNDGLADQILVPGARSFSIWSADGRLVFDSGADFERITAAAFPDNFNASNSNNSIDNRSDNKGPEPEAVAIGEIDGRFYAFVGLERIGGIMIYDVTDPFAPIYIDYVNARDFSLDVEDQVDVGPEGLTFIPASASPNGENLLLVSSEVSGSTAVYQIDGTEETTLQILHASDLEGGVDALDSAPNFAAIVEALELDALGRGVPTLVLSAGDNIIPGPFFSAAGDGSIRPILQASGQDFFQQPGLTNLREASGRVDISIMNIIGFDASAFGNHEFDAGVSVLEDIILADIRGDSFGDVRWLGAQFPYLSANLDFNGSALADFYTSDILPSGTFRSLPFDLAAAAAAPKIAPATLVNIGGKSVGVVGATTQLIQQISSPGDVLETTGGSNNMVALAAVLQPVIDSLTEETDIIILVSHLQQLALEEELATLLDGVDVIIAGGSDTLLANEDDILQNGDSAERAYPVLAEDAFGNPVAIVSTDGEYSYVGRLELTFDADGIIVIDSLDDLANGPYATTDAIVAELWGEYEAAFAPGTKGGRVAFLVDEGIFPVIIAKDSNIVGTTNVYIEGSRERVRTEETTLGNLTADANIWAARLHDETVRVSLKNGGGIRAAIGQVSGNSGLLLPPQTNPISGKQAGEISQLDIENALRFNNGLTIVTVTAEELVLLLEHGVAGTAPGSTPGQFPQVGGLAFSFDPEGTPIEFDDEANVITPGTRLRNLVLLDDAGQPDVQILQDGELVVSADYEIRMVTLNFLWGIFSDSDFIGGDGYPFPAFSEDVVQLDDVLVDEGEFTFSGPGGEQDALAEFLNAFYSDAPYDVRETSAANDTRIIILGEAADSLQPSFSLDTNTLNVGAAGGSFNLSVAGPAFAQWQAEEDSDWLSFGDIMAKTTVNGAGSGQLPLVVEANDSVSSRGALITVAGQEVVVFQSGLQAEEASFGLDPNGLNINGLGGQQAITVFGSSGLSWEASAPATWVSIVSGSSGTGNGTVILSIARNTTDSPRSTTVTIGTESFVINQGANVLNIPQPNRLRLPPSEVQERPDGSFEIDWFGRFFFFGNEGFTVHDDWGITYLPDVQPNEGSLWFFADGIGWLFTNEEVEPWVYSNRSQDWLFLLREGGDSFVYDSAQSAWFRL